MTMTRKDYNAVSTALTESIAENESPEQVTRRIARHLRAINGNFRTEVFFGKCGLDDRGYPLPAPDASSARAEQKEN